MTVDVTDLSVCIVNWNTRDVLAECVDSVNQFTSGIIYEIIVTDNASTDGSVEMIRQRYPEVKLVEMKQNCGYAVGCNRAIEISNGDCVLLLNSDTVVRQDALSAMVEFMREHPEAGALGCKLLNTDGTVQRSVRHFPSYRDLLYRRTILGRFGLFKGVSQRTKMLDFACEEATEVDQPSGAALMLRKTVLDEVGLLDENYFLFYEEIDLCRRVKNAGHKIFFLPGVAITHHGGLSRHQNQSELYVPSARSMFRYLEKHRGVLRTRAFKIVYKPLFLADMILRVFVDLASWVKYRAIKKNVSRADKRWRFARQRMSFLRRDFFAFLFRC